ncbi:MAG: cupredoxin domain-containing protein [Patescibacteria group bacterium]
MIKKIETIYIILGIAIIVLLAIAGFFIISLETAAPSNANKASSNSNKDNIQGAEDSKNNNLNSASAANVNQINDNLNTLVNSPPSREATADNKNTAANSNKSAGPSAKTFTVTAKSWDFEPKTIKVKKGDKVTLNIKATDVAHGFMIPEFNIDEMLPAGKTTKVEFTASKSGTFNFSCSWICGEGHSKMTGQLIVE